MLEVRELYVGYYRELHILRGVTLVARPGQMTAVLGANGVGKSTLLKAIFGFLEPAGGHVRLDGTEITGTPPHRMVERGVAYGPQQPGIFAEMTVEENIRIGAWTFRRDARRIRRKLDENYARFPLLWARRRSPAVGMTSGCSSTNSPNVRTEPATLRTTGSSGNSGCFTGATLALRASG